MVSQWWMVTKINNIRCGNKKQQQKKHIKVIKHWDLDKGSQCLTGAFDLLLCSGKLNQTLTNPEVLTTQEQHKTTFCYALLSTYVSMWKGNLSSCHKQRGVLLLARRILYWRITWGCVLASSNFFPVNNGSCVGILPWISFFFSFLLIGGWGGWGSMDLLTKSMDKKKPWSPGCCNGFPFVTLRDFYTLHLHFGRTTSPWKIHHCLGVFPHVQNAAGQNSVASWSFWNDFGRTSRLTGVNITSSLWRWSRTAFDRDARWFSKRGFLLSFLR